MNSTQHLGKKNDPSSHNLAQKRIRGKAFNSFHETHSLTSKVKYNIRKKDQSLTKEFS